MLTEPAFIRRLETLYLLARKVLGGTLQADRTSARKGAGLTFADYSEYSHGDDYRAIDWKVYARFDQLVIKLFEVEEDLSLHILLDASPSMSGIMDGKIGGKIGGKWALARQLAAALGYIALHGSDRVTVDIFAHQVKRVLDPVHGRGQSLPFLRTLERATVFGVDSDLATSVRAFQARLKRRGLVVIISDFLFPDGADAACKLLQWHGHEVFCVQVQDDQDRLCSARGDIELACVESDARLRVTVTPELARRYEDAVRELNEALRRTCTRRGIGLVSTTTDIAFDTVIQRILRSGGLVA